MWLSQKVVELFNSVFPTRQIYVVRSRPGLSDSQYMLYFILFCLIHTAIQKFENILFQWCWYVWKSMKVSKKKKKKKSIRIAGICQFICGSKGLKKSPVFSDSCTQNIKAVMFFSCKTRQCKCSPSDHDLNICFYGKLSTSKEFHSL